MKKDSSKILVTGRCCRPCNHPNRSIRSHISTSAAVGVAWRSSLGMWFCPESPSVGGLLFLLLRHLFFPFPSPSLPPPLPPSSHWPRGRHGKRMIGGGLTWWVDVPVHLYGGGLGIALWSVLPAAHARPPARRASGGGGGDGWNWMRRSPSGGATGGLDADADDRARRRRRLGSSSSHSRAVW